MGTHTSTTSLYVQPGSHPHPSCHLEDCLWMLSLKGVGPLVRSWGEFRNTLGSLRPLSCLCSLGSTKKFYFFSSTMTTFTVFHHSSVSFCNNSHSSLC